MKKVKKKRIKVSDTSKIPKNKLKTKKLIRDSLCSNRIHALYADMIKETIDGKEIDMAKVKMDICNMNNLDNEKNDTSNERLNLIKERMRNQPSSENRFRDERRDRRAERREERDSREERRDRRPERREERDRRSERRDSR